MDFDLSLGFQHVAVKQKKNLCKSRLDADTSSEIIKGIKRPIPLIASNMNTVCNSDFCIQLFELGALGVMHRAADKEFILQEIRKISTKCPFAAASVGVGKGQLDFAKSLRNAGCNIIVIDIAHGFCDQVIDLGRRIKDLGVKVVLGNTICIDMLHDVSDFADALKVGVASGAACETKNMTGCYEHQFSAVYKFKEASKELGVPIISDGGIREPADVVKSIGAGANSVMAGSIFARCPESAAETVSIHGSIKKIYSGMASRDTQNKWRGGLKEGTCPEGKTIYLDIGESVKDLLTRYAGALRSGITYGGGVDVPSFQDSVEFIRLL